MIGTGVAITAAPAAITGIAPPPNIQANKAKREA
jgi:hypothetical protein